MQNREAAIIHEDDLFIIQVWIFLSPVLWEVGLPLLGSKPGPQQTMFSQPSSVHGLQTHVRTYAHTHTHIHTHTHAHKAK